MHTNQRPLLRRENSCTCFPAFCANPKSSCLAKKKKRIYISHQDSKPSVSYDLNIKQKDFACFTMFLDFLLSAKLCLEH